LLAWISAMLSVLSNELPSCRDMTDPEVIGHTPPTISGLEARMKLQRSSTVITTFACAQQSVTTSRHAT